MKKISILLVTTLLLSSCVSKKKYLALEQENGEIKSQLTKTQVEKEDLENKFAVIEARVNDYNSKIQSLNQDVEGLSIQNKAKFEVSKDGTVASGASKEKMRATLQNISPEKLAGAKTLKDSMNLAVQYNLSKAINTNDLDENEDTFSWQQGFYASGEVGDVFPPSNGAELLDYCPQCALPRLPHEKFDNVGVLYYFQSENIIRSLDQVNLPRPEIITNVTILTEGHQFSVELFQIALRAQADSS